MTIFEQLASYGHEQIVFCRNDDVGLRAIIAIHDTTLGPALGGCRLYDYPTEGDAVRDVLRLSRGMTYKAAVAGLDLGGGKAVLIGDPSTKSESMFRAFGRHVESLGDRYITAEDMNTSVEDMDNIRRETRWVTGSGHGSGDPSPVTAWGCYHGIRACLEVIYGSPDVQGRTVAIQGAGNVGYWLAKYLHEGGANLMYADISNKRLARVMEEFGGTVIEGDDFYRANCDVLAPCAIGGIINHRTIPLIKAPIIAGGANNQLDDEQREARRSRSAASPTRPTTSSTPEASSTCARSSRAPVTRRRCRTRPPSSTPSSASSTRPSPREAPRAARRTAWRKSASRWWRG